MKQLTPNQFDAQIRQSLEGLEMPYNAAAWSRFEATLPAQTAIPSSRNNWLKAAVVALIVATVSIAVYQFSIKESSTTAPIASQQSVSETVVTAISPEAITSEPRVIAKDGATKSKSLAKQESEKRFISNGIIKENGSESNTNVSSAPELVAERPEKTNAKTPPLLPNPERTAQAEVMVALKVSKRTVCVGEKIDFMAVTGTGGLTYEWLFTDGDNYSGAELTRSFQAAGQFDVTMVASKDGKSWTRSETMVVSPTPEPRIIGLEDRVGNIPIYSLSTELQAGEKCTWRFDDRMVVSAAEVRHLFRKKHASEVELTVSNNQGCSASVRQPIAVESDFNLFTEMAFSPNVDNLNETFLPAALLAMDCAFEMVIRDKNLKEIYRTSNTLMPWNGRDQSDNLQPKGVYFWTVELKEEILNDRIFRGEVSLR